MVAFQNWQKVLDAVVKSFSETSKLNEFAKLTTNVDRVKYITENATLR